MIRYALDVPGGSFAFEQADHEAAGFGADVAGAAIKFVQKKSLHVRGGTRTRSCEGLL